MTADRTTTMLTLSSSDSDTELTAYPHTVTGDVLLTLTDTGDGHYQETLLPPQSARQMARALWDWSGADKAAQPRLTAEEILTILDGHRVPNQTAGWEGCPNPRDWRNIRLVCQCGQVIGDPTQDPIGYALLQHQAEVLAR